MLCLDCKIPVIPVLVCVNFVCKFPTALYWYMYVYTQKDSC